MSRRFSQGNLQGQERKSVIQEVQKQAKAAALAAIEPVVRAFLEEEVTAKLGRAKGEPRRVCGQPREIDWQCGSCGCHDANQFTRDGHSRRRLQTGWGELADLQVPMLECQNCQHDVVAQWTILEKVKRFWLDLEQDVLFGSGLCQSLRESLVSAGVPRWKAAWACARSTSASISSPRSWSKPARKRSRMCQPWCSSMAFG